MSSYVAPFLGALVITALFFALYERFVTIAWYEFRRTYRKDSKNDHWSEAGIKKAFAFQYPHRARVKRNGWVIFLAIFGVSFFLLTYFF